VIIQYNIINLTIHFKNILRPIWPSDLEN
jgi:hypothetical protein